MAILMHTAVLLPSGSEATCTHNENSNYMHMEVN